jgi:hypothetical protein
MAQEFNHFGEIALRLHEAASQIVRKTAFDIQGGAQQRSHVDLGFQKASIYVVTNASSTYGAAASAARSRNPKAVMLPEVDTPPDDQQAIVAVGADYGIVNEYGGARHAAQPFLTPAAEAVGPAFQSALEQLELRG